MINPLKEEAILEKVVGKDFYLEESCKKSLASLRRVFVLSE